MSDQRNKLIWGVVLIVLGGLFLIQTLGLIPEFSQTFWAVSLGLACLFFVVVYVYGGKTHWGWLFPIFITGGLSLAAALSFTTLNPIWIGALFMACISAPFWIIFLFNRQDNWWALIPGWVTAVLTLIILVSEQWAGETIGAIVMWSVALPFIVVYFRNREHWWALIPGFIMGGMGVVVLLASQSAEEVVGTFVLLMMALPFLAVFFFVKGQWWAIIPAGFFLTTALMVPFAAAAESNNLTGRLIGAFFFLGCAVPFAWLWWRHDVYPTAWAKYPTVGLVAAAVVTLALGSILENSWPIALIVIGIWLLYDNMHQPKLRS